MWACLCRMRRSFQSAGFSLWTCLFLTFATAWRFRLAVSATFVALYWSRPSTCPPSSYGPSSKPHSSACFPSKSFPSQTPDSFLSHWSGFSTCQSNLSCLQHVLLFTALVLTVLLHSLLEFFLMTLFSSSVILWALYAIIPLMQLWLRSFAWWPCSLKVPRKR